MPFTRHSGARRRGTRLRATRYDRTRVTVTPAAASRAGSPPRHVARRRTACTAVPKILVFSTSGTPRAPASPLPVRGTNLEIGRSAKMPFSSLTVPSARFFAAGIRDTVTVLGLVQVVSGDEHRHAGASQSSRAPEGVATAGSTPPVARRGRQSAAHAGWRNRAPAAAAILQTARPSWSFPSASRPCRDEARRTSKRSAARHRSRRKSDVLVHGELLVQREAL